MSKLKMLAVVFSCVTTPSLAIADPAIVAGDPCQKSNGACLSINASGDIPTIAILKFTAPTAGKISVTASGAMQCGNFSGSDDSNSGVADLNAQIVRDNAAPNAAGPGGARYAMRLAPLSPALIDYSASVNLTTTRVLAVAKGANVFRYKMSRNRIDSSVNCNVLNVTMTGIFVP